MGKICIDITGQTFGRLTVIEKTNEKSHKGEIKWLCKCSCGNTCIVIGSRLRGGYTQSCGCLNLEVKTKHGKTHTRLFALWQNMRKRCYATYDKNYKNYGARGISVCEKWKNDFQSFYDWAIQNGYDEKAQRGKCTLDRIDVNGNYEPSNCRWVTQKVQCNNQRKNHFLTFNNEIHTLAEWSEKLNMKTGVILARLKMGWSVEKTLTTPVRKLRKKGGDEKCS